MTQSEHDGWSIGLIRFKMVIMKIMNIEDIFPTMFFLDKMATHIC